MYDTLEKSIQTISKLETVTTGATNSIDQGTNKKVVNCKQIPQENSMKTN